MYHDVARESSIEMTDLDEGQLLATEAMFLLDPFEQFRFLWNRTESA